MSSMGSYVLCVDVGCVPSYDFDVVICSLLMFVADTSGDHYGRAPNDTPYKRWSCRIGYKLLCKFCRNHPPPAMGDRFTVFGKPTMRTHWMAGAAPHKSG